MIIGIPKEIKNEEHRVGLLPDGEACRKKPGLAEGVNVFDGRLTCAAVAEAFGLPFTPFTTT